jgi:hypothetical protein
MSLMRISTAGSIGLIASAAPGIRLDLRERRSGKFGHHFMMAYGTGIVARFLGELAT